MSDELSVYLDLVRLLAALAVLVGHLDQDGMYASWLLIGNYAHSAVVVFFVLSGLVISHSAFNREQDWRSYAVARFSRIESVVIPAIILSFTIKALAVWLDPDSLAGEFFGTDLSLKNLFGGLFFLNQSWGYDTELPWNGPFWFLCYEVWYYIIFGLAHFLPPQRRWIWVGLAALLAGPAILVLFPIWLLGSWLAQHGQRFVPTKLPSVFLWAGTLLAIVTLVESGADVQLRTWFYEHVPGFWRLRSSQRFVTDYLLGALVAFNFIAFRGLGDGASQAMTIIRKPIIFFAGFTFSLYLYHRPMTYFAGHFFPNRDHSMVITLSSLVIIIALCLLLGQISEQKKHVVRAWARRAVGRSQNT